MSLPANFNYVHVYFHFVKSIGDMLINGDNDGGDEEIGVDTLTAKPLRKGRELLKSGFVEDVQDKLVEDSGDYAVGAHVQHSMKKLLPLNVNVVLSNVSGYVRHASCDCKASSRGRCAHIAAVLLKLSDTSTAEENIVTPSTSKPCTWNKGKKREKKPQKLHLAEYASRKRKPLSQLYNWDPRPEENRGFSESSVSNFITGLCSENITMSETLLSTKYEDFVLDETDIAHYKALSEQFEKELQDYNINLLNFSLCCEIPDTYSQITSPKWKHERMFRIIASVCRTVVNLGGSISPNDSLQPHFNYLEKQFWFPSSFLNSHMKYGIDNEVIAVKDYCNAKQTSVKSSGLWINADYVHLAASPDGLIYGDSNKHCGIVEIKCLNILRLHSVEDIVRKNCPDAEIKRQCFIIEGDKLILKRTHSYFYQVQLQLLVTMA